MKYLAFLVLLLGLPLLVFGQTTTDPGTGFVPLTNVPFLTETGNAFSLETFLNGLYRISIGIAAVVAVLQIMRAGIMYMGSDSGFAEKKEAKNLIALSIGGLILVLSPVVVFSVINPEILSLKIGNIEKLAPAFEGADRVLWTDTTNSRSTAKARCETDGGVASFTCQVPGSGEARVVPITEACAAGEDGITVCRATGNVPTNTTSCTEQYTNITAIGAGGSCNAAGGYTPILKGCCSGAAAGAVCCGKPKP